MRVKTYRDYAYGKMVLLYFPSSWLGKETEVLVKPTEAIKYGKKMVKLGEEILKELEKNG